MQISFGAKLLPPRYFYGYVQYYMKLVGEFCWSHGAVISVVDFNVVKAVHILVVFASGLGVVNTQCLVWFHSKTQQLACFHEKRKITIFTRNVEGEGRSQHPKRLCGESNQEQREARSRDVTQLVIVSNGCV